MPQPGSDRRRAQGRPRLLGRVLGHIPSRESRRPLAAYRREPFLSEAPQGDGRRRGGTESAQLRPGDRDQRNPTRHEHLTPRRRGDVYERIPDAAAAQCVRVRADRPAHPVANPARRSAEDHTARDRLHRRRNGHQPRLRHNHGDHDLRHTADRACHVLPRHPHPSWRRESTSTSGA